MNRSWWCLALLVAASTRVHAQGARTVALSVSAGAHASYPEQLSASLVLRASFERFDGTRQGYAVLLEPGLHGGRLIFGREAVVGPGILTSGIGALLTWTLPPSMTRLPVYLVTEQRLTINWLTVGIGFGVRVSSDPSPIYLAAVNNGSSAQPAVASFLVTGVLGGRFEF